MPHSYDGAPGPCRAELIVIEGEDLGKVLVLTGQSATLGRAGDNAVQLEDLRVSSHHAELIAHGDGYLVSDLGSRNGTAVNGQEIQDTHRLSPGDEISVGNTRLVYRSARDVSAESPPAAVPQDGPEALVAEPDAPLDATYPMADRTPLDKPTMRAEPEASAAEPEAEIQEDGVELDPTPAEEAGHGAEEAVGPTDGQPPSTAEAVKAWLRQPKVAICITLVIIIAVGSRFADVIREDPSQSFLFAPGIEGNLKCKNCGAVSMGTLMQAPGRCNKCGQDTVCFIRSCPRCRCERLSESPSFVGLCLRCEARDRTSPD